MYIDNNIKKLFYQFIQKSSSYRPTRITYEKHAILLKMSEIERYKILDKSMIIKNIIIKY